MDDTPRCRCGFQEPGGGMPRGRNRREPGGGMPAKMPANQKKPRWLTWGRWLFFASGWVAAVFVGVLELPAKIVSFSENYAPAKATTLNAAIDYQKYVGRFSSDPNSWVGLNLVRDGPHPPYAGDRTSVVSGKMLSDRVDIGVRSSINNKRIAKSTE